MNRVFGSRTNKEKVPKPTLNDAINSIDERTDSIEVKIRKLEAEILRYRDQLSKMREGPSKNIIKQKALKVLKQKKMYESQRDMLMQQSFNMEQTNFATENLKNTVTTIETMKIASKEIKSQFKKMNIDKIENMQDDMADLLEQADEIQEVMSRSYGMPEGIDDDELEAELDALGDDLLFEDAMPSYLDETSSTVPNFLPENPEKAEEQKLRTEFN